jgi:allantoicase
VAANASLTDGAGSIHRFLCPASVSSTRLTHLRLDQLPDGGIARLKVWGVVHRDFDTEVDERAVGRINLLAEEMGARAVGASDSHYGEKRAHGAALVGEHKTENRMGARGEGEGAERWRDGR